ncbi:DNA-binding protein [Phakopsora pachyrhizi]|uniref:DNA-binding protein n=1 Tax=Phakopsora pachyrhizi TaxID=170000 RepID=A0AAV0BCC1_PHAPC|nr:DNA-binding protein [Phakopsora pachyrhizi]CAH7677478.1 DNA-binding protein [Phakopsora pachyrhizi]CAH7683889.1 DNA-binding protein [Phakopsora pachyrhizi]
MSTTKVPRRATGGGTTTRVRPNRTTNATNQKQRISLAGSTAVVSDYFHYAVNCILFQRAVYDQADFKMVKKFGLQMMVVEDEAIASHIQKIIDQVRVWLLEGKLSRLVLVIQRKDDGETLERWEFDVKIEEEDTQKENLRAQGDPNQKVPANEDNLEPEKELRKDKRSKSLAEIQTEIQQIIRQIIATVSFLPIPESTRTFKVLAYTDRVGKDDTNEWKDSEAFDITDGGERVKLKSFSTSVHKVDTAVDYK